MAVEISAYRIFDIAPPGAANTYATGLNDSGEIVGYTSGSSGNSGFTYAGGTFHILPIPVLAVPLAINNAGEVVGGYRGPDGSDDGFIYQNGAMESFTPQGDAFLGAAGVNENGVLIGNVYANNNNRGFIYGHGTFTDLRTDFRATFGLHGPGLDTAGDYRAITTGLNDQGEVVGTYRAVATDSDNSPRFGFIDYNGAITLLRVPGTTNTDALAINNAGEIVGDSDAGGFVYQNGSYTILNDPQAATGTTAAVGLNDQGDIIGNYKDTGGTSHGFVYRDGTYVTIDAPGAVSTTLSNVNSTGEIAGNYTASDGTHRAFLADPVGPPLTLIQSTLTHTAAGDQALQGLYNQLLANAQNVHPGDQAQFVPGLMQVLTEAQTGIGIDFSKMADYATASASGRNAAFSFNPDGVAAGRGATLAAVHGVGSNVTLGTLIHGGSSGVS